LGKELGEGEYDDVGGQRLWRACFSTQMRKIVVPIIMIFAIVVASLFYHNTLYQIHYESLSPYHIVLSA
jgi:hypothetical protein